jgi:two-component system LytT family sensor kinase
LWVLPLSIFAVSALHLGQHTGRESWPTELVGHHASLPLAVAILLRDYRFALADIFLKRALALTLVIVAIATVHATIGLRWLPTADVAVTTYLLVLVLAAVLLQEPARAFGAWVVDTVVLRRPDTSAVVRAVEEELAGVAEPAAIPAIAAARLGAALDAAWIEARVVVDPVRPRDLGARVLAGADAARFLVGTRTRRIDGLDPDAPPRSPLAAIVAVPTVDAPLHVWCVGPLTGGRRWLSDDVALAESVAFLTARRLDALRVAEERYAAALRERQIRQLATEAELRALRAQLNPHFLFNALTTIGYLIQVAPAKAQSTLMRLTSLLRGVLRRSTTAFSRLGDEVALVHAYLEIEEARFEERLRVRLAVDPALDDVLIPSLLLQPLVENAVKHGVAPLAAGGTVEVTAAVDGVRADGHAILTLTVRDSGVGHAPRAPFDAPGEGLGLANVAQRLRAHFGDQASLAVDGVPGSGTTATITLPVRLPRTALAAAAPERTP